MDQEQGSVIIKILACVLNKLVQRNDAVLYINI